MSIKIISAGAGSGKTYRLTRELIQMLREGVRPSGLIATTFTKKAAAELQERVRVGLLSEGLSEQANELSNALIGTVHALGVKLLQRFAFEAGMSPQLSIIAEEDQQHIFNQALAMVLTQARIDKMGRLTDNLGLNNHSRDVFYDWRGEVKRICDAARANSFDKQSLEKSKRYSVESLFAFLPPVLDKDIDWKTALRQRTQESLDLLNANSDETKKTAAVVDDLKRLLLKLKRNESLPWQEWAKLQKLSVGAKSREDVAALQEYATIAEQLPTFREHISDYISALFDIAIDALDEFARYKKERGLVDYTDMETAVNELLDNPLVQQTLKSEIDLLMVDEFQDTSPIQLSIFWKLSQLSGQSVWVGDPKQSIYGFRGADPAIMRGIIEHLGGVKPENIQKYSWRSRKDLVDVSNAIFSKAFSEIPVAQVALEAKRLPTGSAVNEDEPLTMGVAVHNWQFSVAEGGRIPGRDWYDHCIAQEVRKLLQEGHSVYDKTSNTYRPMKAGDIAVLCRSNFSCNSMAEALSNNGLEVSISRSGLLKTTEAQLVLACLRYILNENDSLSVAEVMLLAGEMPLQNIIDNRLEYLQKSKDYGNYWGEEVSQVAQLQQMRTTVADMSASEVLAMLIDQLHIRHLLAKWTNFSQRLTNIDQLIKYALQYEDACNRLQSAASLGGFLIWLNELSTSDEDQQGISHSPEQVQVMTYHRSKGLEWPMVICHDLEATLKDKLFGLSVLSEKEEVNVQNLLADRLLRYWVNPYGTQYQKTPLQEAISAGDEQKAATRQALEEEARLLYVGMTRARDYLVLPQREKRNTKWLNRVCADGDESAPALQGEESYSPWSWNDEQIRWNLRKRAVDREITRVERPPTTVRYHQLPDTKAEHLPFYINAYRDIPSGLSVSANAIARILKPLSVPDDVSASAVSKVLKSALAGTYFSDKQTTHTQVAEAVIKNAGLTGELEAAELSAYTYASRNTILQLWPGCLDSATIKYPIRAGFDRRLFITTCDLLCVNGKHFHILQNSSYNGADKKTAQKIKELAPWCHYVSESLKQAFGADVTVDTYIHLVMKGVIYEVS